MAILGNNNNLLSPGQFPVISPLASRLIVDPRSWRILRLPLKGLLGFIVCTGKVYYRELVSCL